MRIATGLLLSLCSIALMACVNTDAEDDTTAANEAITADGVWTRTAVSCGVPLQPNNGPCPGGTAAIGQPCSPIGATCFVPLAGTSCNFQGIFRPLFGNATCQ